MRVSWSEAKDSTKLLMKLESRKFLPKITTIKKNFFKVTSKDVFPLLTVSLLYTFSCIEIKD